jgi:hypothetical protein
MVHRLKRKTQGGLVDLELLAVYGTKGSQVNDGIYWPQLRHMHAIEPRENGGMAIGVTVVSHLSRWFRRLPV